MVNLIPYNEVRGLPWQRPADVAQESFLRAVERQRVAVTLRREKGRDIDAACGQLRLRTEGLRASGDELAQSVTVGRKAGKRA
jgi:23S rRNA (adenine2503-C2)-methyltransferase